MDEQKEWHSEKLPDGRIAFFYGPTAKVNRDRQYRWDRAWMKTAGCRLTLPWWRRLQRACRQNDTTMYRVILDAVKAYAERVPWKLEDLDPPTEKDILTRGRGGD